MKRAIIIALLASVAGVAQVAPSPTPVTSLPLVTISATCTSTCPIQAVNGNNTVAFQVAGTHSAFTLAIQGTTDNTNYSTLTVTAVAGGATSTSITANGLYTANIAGLTNVKYSLTALTGTNVTLKASFTAATPSGAGGSGGGGGSVTQGTSPWVDNITQWNSVNLGSPSNYGTSPGAVAVPGVNAFVTNSVAVTGTFFQATQPVSAASLPLPSNAAQETGGNLATVAGTVNGTAVQTDLLPTSSATFGIAPISSTALETNHVLKGSAGNLYSVCATIGATSGYLMVFDATTLPSNGSVTPKLWQYIPTLSATANTGCLSYNGQPPAAFSTGIVVGFSTTGPFTLTASNAAFSGSVK